jgi:uncharacterized protein (TIGR00255 family)
LIQSMTGYGEAERRTEEGLLRVEIRTVNHRHFNAQLRMPPGFDRHEAEVLRWLRAAITRGHVHYGLSFESDAEAAGDVAELDLERARGYRRLLETLGSELDLPGTVDLELLTRFRDIIRAPEPDRELPRLELDDVRAVTDAACAAVVAMRRVEGERLRTDLAGRLAEIERRLRLIEERAPERLTAERDRLRAAIRELGEGIPLDEERIAREVAHMAERWDIHEEIVRLSAHLDHFRENLGDAGSAGEVESAGGGKTAETKGRSTASAGAPEPVGKRLGFIVQEMHRETNTIGAKANDTQIAQEVMGIKEEIERLREQLENVE